MLKGGDGRGRLPLRGGQNRVKPLEPRIDEIVGVAFRYENVTIVPDMYIFQPGGRLYVEAANGALRDQIAFGSSYPFRAMRQSADDYGRLGFTDEALERVFFSNAARLLKID